MKALLLIAAGFVASSAVHAESRSLDQLLQAATVDMPVTTAPAAFLLGTSGETVPRLSTFRAFSTQIGRALDETGKIKNGVAAEIAPTLALRTTTWEDIQNSQVMRILSRSTVSFATKAGGDSGSAKSAVGLQMVLYSREMDDAKDVDRTAPSDQPGPPPKLPPEQLAAIEKCQKDVDAVLTKWNQTMVALGAGKVFSTADASGVKPKDPSAIWVTAAYGSDISGGSEKAEARLGYLLTAHYRRTRDAAAVSTSGVDTFADQKLAGVNFRFGNARLAGIAEYSRTTTGATQGLAFNDRKRSVLGLEYKVSTDMYLTVGVARDTGLPAAEQSVLAKLNWGFSKAPVLATGRP
jgi:hypothetical protein